MLARREHRRIDIGVGGGHERRGAVKNGSRTAVGFVASGARKTRDTKCTGHLVANFTI